MTFSTAAILPSLIRTCPGASVGPDTVCTVAPVSKTVSVNAGTATDKQKPSAKMRTTAEQTGRFPGNENSRVDTLEPRENIERPTSNTQRRNGRGFALPFDVRRWMFDVGCSSGFMESPGGSCDFVPVMISSFRLAHEVVDL